jgi:hypothetical protein
MTSLAWTTAKENSPKECFSRSLDHRSESPREESPSLLSSLFIRAYRLTGFQHAEAILASHESIPHFPHQQSSENSVAKKDWILQKNEMGMRFCRKKLGNFMKMGDRPRTTFFLSFFCFELWKMVLKSER